MWTQCDSANTVIHSQLLHIRNFFFDSIGNSRGRKLHISSVHKSLIKILFLFNDTTKIIENVFHSVTFFHVRIIILRWFETIWSEFYFHTVWIIIIIIISQTFVIFEWKQNEKLWITKRLMIWQGNSYVRSLCISDRCSYKINLQAEPIQLTLAKRTHSVLITQSRQMLKIKIKIIRWLFFFVYLKCLQTTVLATIKDMWILSNGKNFI